MTKAFGRWSNTCTVCWGKTQVHSQLQAGRCWDVTALSLRSWLLRFWFIQTADKAITLDPMQMYPMWLQEGIALFSPAADRKVLLVCSGTARPDTKCKSLVPPNQHQRGTVASSPINNGTFLLFYLEEGLASYCSWGRHQICADTMSFMSLCGKGQRRWTCRARNH